MGNDTVFPREKLKNLGVEELSVCDLLALILGRGTAQKNVFALALELEYYLASCKQVPGISDLMGIKGLGYAKAAQITACLEFSRRFLLAQNVKSVKTPEELIPHLAFLKYEKQETFVAITLSSANSILKIHNLTVGLVNQTQIHPREAFVKAIEDRAVAVVFAHNHPSGNLQPSRADEEMTGQLCQSGRILGIEVLDHLIIGASGFCSLRRINPALFA
ncbi:MAG: DNA repair protein RadC [Fibrobacter sp.]|jgi:DNA repair protein RadC|nr:DNA repair protein RadC [Fibrobacter sp.]